MVEVGQTHDTWGGFQIVITKVGKRFIKAKIPTKEHVSLGVIRYLKEPIDSGRYCAFGESAEYDFHESLLSSEPDGWGPWVETSSDYEMVAMTKGVVSEIRFDASSNVMAYRVKKE